MKTTLFTFALLFSSFIFSQTINISPFGTGFSTPVDIAHPLRDSRLFIVEQGGAIKILNANGTTNPINFLTLTNLISTGSERGLLGLAFHPNYSTNGFFYVNYTNTAGNTVVARYTVDLNNPNLANLSSGSIILTVAQPYENHNGGCLRFGPDGFLYIGMGDGGSGGDPQNRAQNINENLGKMLRIDVNSAAPYGIPSTNPFVGIAGNDEIWAIGLRNPWRFSFNRNNGDLWIADVGQNLVEEINKVSSSAAGLNYGWRCYEGNLAFNTTGCAPLNTMTAPVATYTHSSISGCSITGGYVYTGSNYPNFLTQYFFADYCNNKIGLLNTSGMISWSTAFPGTNFTAFGEDLNGELYVAGGTSGSIYKIIDSSLGVNNAVKEDLKLYPIPATTEVFITTSTISFPAIVLIYDSIGKLLSNQTLDSENQTINTSSLQKGIYIVRLEDFTGANYSSKLTIK